MEHHSAIEYFRNPTEIIDLGEGYRIKLKSYKQRDYADILVAEATLEQEGLRIPPPPSKRDANYDPNDPKYIHWKEIETFREWAYLSWWEKLRKKKTLTGKLIDTMKIVHEQAMQRYYQEVDRDTALSNVIVEIKTR